MIKLLQEHTHNFVLFSTNIASIKSQFDELAIFVDELKQNNEKFGAICLQETWLAHDENYSLFNLTGYTCISQTKRCSERGGLVIYLNDIYNYTQLPICNNFEKWEAQFLEISGRLFHKKMIIVLFLPLICLRSYIL